jgi:hypothetical protein
MVRQYVSKEEFEKWVRQAYSSIPARHQEIFVPQSMEQIAKQVLGGTPMADRELTWEEMLAQIQTEDTRTEDEKILDAEYEISTGEIAQRAIPRPPIRPTVVTPEPTWTAPSYDELTQALPILGMTVMLNESGRRNIATKFHGVKGIIYDLQGSDSSTRNVIRKYKANGYVESWEVSVRFETGESRNIRISQLQKVSSDKEAVRYTDDWDGVYLFFEEGSQAERDKLDERAIVQKMPLSNRKIYPKSEQESKYNRA